MTFIDFTMLSAIYNDLHCFSMSLNGFVSVSMISSAMHYPVNHSTQKAAG